VSNSLNVSKREQTGSLRMKRMRQGGQIPAVLYGGNGDSVLLSVPQAELSKVIQSGSREVELTGSVNQKAKIQSIQWNTFGNEILHLDLTRVS
jgi:large subunit ribosomal protein L25